MAPPVAHRLGRAEDLHCGRWQSAAHDDRWRRLARPRGHTGGQPPHDGRRQLRRSPKSAAVRLLTSDWISARRTAGQRAVIQALRLVGCIAIAGMARAGSWTGRMFMHRHPGLRTHSSDPIRAADRVFLDRRGAGTPSRRACRTGLWLPRGEADRGSRRGRRAVGAPAGTPRCRRRPWPASGSGPGPGHELPDGRGRRPWIIQRAEPRQAAKPRERYGRAGRLRFSSPGRGRTRLPGASAPRPGITLSDAGDQGERTRTRRSGRLWTLQQSAAVARRSSRSVPDLAQIVRTLGDRGGGGGEVVG